jgi:hypothetical protein
LSIAQSDAYCVHECIGQIIGLVFDADSVPAHLRDEVILGTPFVGNGFIEGVFGDFYLALVDIPRDADCARVFAEIG